MFEKVSGIQFSCWLKCCLRLSCLFCIVLLMLTFRSGEMTGKYYAAELVYLSGTGKAPSQFAGLTIEKDTGYTRWYLKEGSNCTLRDIRWMLNPEDREQRTQNADVCYVPFSVREAYAYWNEIEQDLVLDSIFEQEYLVTGGLEFDPQLGYRAFLFLEGESADEIQTALKSKYGNFVQFDSDIYDFEYFESKYELAMLYAYYKYPVSPTL